MKSSSITEALEHIKLAFSGCSDFNHRLLTLKSGKSGYLLNIGSYTDRDYISESIIRPVLSAQTDMECAKELFGFISSSELSIINDENEAIQKLLSGFAIIMLETKTGFEIYACMVRMTASRSVAEPGSETVLRGPREGFIENSEDNLALLRKRLKTTHFKSTRLTSGKYTDTTVYICFIEGIANYDTVERVKRVIENAKMTGIIDSGYFEHYLQKKSPSLFTGVGSSEKPDVVAAKLLEGRVAVICEGSPIVLTVPYLFIESLQSAEDYLKTPFYASFMRILRFISVIISLYLPAIYLSSIEHHSSTLPYKLYKTVMELRQDVPFGVFGELLTVLFIFELIREVGIRMPKAVGSAVSIVAGLILGDAAISSHLASAPVIMVSSLTAVCTFIIPTFMNSAVLIRFINIILAQIFGFPGIIISACFIAACLAKKESFGVPYLLPFAPIKPKGLLDSIISVPKKTLQNTENAIYERKDS